MGKAVVRKSCTAEIWLSSCSMSINGLEGLLEHLLCEFVQQCQRPPFFGVINMG